MPTHEVFTNRYTLIQLIEWCDQQSLRALLQPNCKSLRDENVIREIAKRLKLTRDESIKAFRMKWKYIGSVHTLDFAWADGITEEDIVDFKDVETIHLGGYGIRNKICGGAYIWIKYSYVY